MSEWALTYPQLMNQALKKGMDGKSLVLLRRAHDAALALFDGCYRAQGIPLINHTIRTASILMSENQSAPVCSAAMLHASYLFGQFSDGRQAKASAVHRLEVRRCVGSEVEEIVYQYFIFPWGTPGSLSDHLRVLPAYSDVSRKALMIRLANELEDHLDHAMAYVTVRSPRVFHRAEEGEKLAHLADQLGLRELARDLETVFCKISSFQVPESVMCRDSVGYHMTQKTRLWVLALKRLRRTSEQTNGRRNAGDPT